MQVPLSSVEPTPAPAEQARIAGGRAGLPGKKSAAAGSSIYGPRPVFELSSWRSGTGRTLPAVGNDGDGSSSGISNGLSSGSSSRASVSTTTSDTDYVGQPFWASLRSNSALTASSSGTGATDDVNLIVGAAGDPASGIPSFLPVGDVWSIDLTALRFGGGNGGNLTSALGSFPPPPEPWRVNISGTWGRDFDPPSPQRLYFHPLDSLYLSHYNLSTSTLEVLARYNVSTWADLAVVSADDVRAMRDD